MKTLKALIAALALASAAPSFAGICCGYGFPNGPALNGVAKAAHQDTKPAQHRATK